MSLSLAGWRVSHWSVGILTGGGDAEACDGVQNQSKTLSGIAFRVIQSVAW